MVTMMASIEQRRVSYSQEAMQIRRDYNQAMEDMLESRRQDELQKTQEEVFQGAASISERMG